MNVQELDLTGPLWVLMRSGMVIGPNNVVRMPLGNPEAPVGEVVPVFTSWERAQECVDAVGDLSVCPYELAVVAGLVSLLNDLKPKGVSHVNFDLNLAQPNPIPIDEVLAFLRSFLNN
jgi:hypothetical protein